jgi:ATP-dependent DNA ligase
MGLPVAPPIRPMLAKATHELPIEGGMSYEPKWDGFRCIVFRDGDDVELASRNEKPLTRYFPEILDALPERVVIDGEIVVVGSNGLDFDLLSQRIHPADSRVQRLSLETPASFVAFDVLALGDEDLRPRPFAVRRALLADLFAAAAPPLHITPATGDPVIAADWFDRFEGAGFDGVIAKPTARAYEENKRAQWKVKHLRTADMVVAGYRMHKDNEGVGSLLLGLADIDGRLHHVGVCSAFTIARRAELVDELAPFVADGAVGHPWRSWSDSGAHAESDQRMPGAPSRWSGQRSHDWVPLRCELVVEVAYQGLQNGNRLRHPARFVRWRPDKDASECRYDQLEQIAPAELAEMFRRS